MLSILVANLKGGVGKTTIAAALADAAVRDGANVSVVDFDPQKSLTRYLRRRAAKNAVTIYQGAQDLACATEALRISGQPCDWLICDTAPAFVEDLLENLAAADLVLVPVAPSSLSLEASLDTLRASVEAGKDPIVVFNMARRLDDRRLVDARGIVEKYEIRAAKTVVMNRVSLEDAFGLAVSPLDGRDKAAQTELLSLWSEVKAVALADARKAGPKAAAKAAGRRK